MDMTSEQRVLAPQTVVWQALNDPEVLAACIPGCEAVAKVSDTEFNLVMTAKLEHYDWPGLRFCPTICLHFIRPEIVMDFVTLREFRTQPGKVWKKLAKARELVVTRNGKPFALLTETSPTKLEDDLRALRRAKAETAVASLRRAAGERGLAAMTPKAINAEIHAARREAKGRHAAGH
ncbi:MAG TPA: SRPBCC domain-containing protein [Acidiferrobacterales bacterium]|nr:SRPBCC domain-containing protein [Acidiferrobacterales bacterium]